MKNKLKYLIGVSLKRKIKTKWFVIANIFLALVIICGTNIDSIINFFGGDFNKKTKIHIIDNTNQSFDLFKTYANENFGLTYSEEDKYEILKYEDNKEAAIEMLKTNESETNSIVIVFNPDEDNVINVEMISNDFSNTMDFTIINTAVNKVKVYLAIEKYDISPEQLAGLTSTIEMERTVLDENKNSSKENMTMIMTTVFPIIILPFFMLVIFLVQMIGAEVNDEKTTRGMEIIISNVSPKVHFFSKCIAGNLFILMQGGLLILYVVIGIFSRTLFDSGETNNIITEVSGMLSEIFATDFLASLSYLIPLILILMIVTFVGYSLLAGILASMTTNTEDFQQLQTPIMLISLLGYYLAIMAGTFKGSIFIKALGYCPFISAILSPSLLVMREFTIFDMLISIGLMLIVIILLIKYGLKIYKAGILNYSTGNLWKKMLNALKTKN